MAHYIFCHPRITFPCCTDNKLLVTLFLSIALSHRTKQMYCLSLCNISLPHIYELYYVLVNPIGLIKLKIKALVLNFYLIWKIGISTLGCRKVLNTWKLIIFPSNIKFSLLEESNTYYKLHIFVLLEHMARVVPLNEH